MVVVEIKTPRYLGMIFNTQVSGGGSRWLLAIGCLFYLKIKIILISDMSLQLFH